MAKLYLTFFSGVFAGTAMWCIDQPIVCLATGATAFIMYCIAWKLVE